MSKSILIAGVALSLLAGCGSSTETAANQASPEDAALATGPDGPPPQVVDVRGLRLGMSVAQVRAALRASGMPVSDTEDRMFAQREIARTKVYAANRMVPEGRPDFETRSEYEFLSSIVSEGPRGSGRLTAMFTPFRGRERAWGARY